jgi:DhnA family fructose-bisphosphate aldolase class Ia
MAFQTTEFFPKSLYAKITETRVSKPDVVTTAADRREKPNDLTYDGKLTLLAADQPARRVTDAAGDPLAIGDRYELLGRILRVLGTEFDGVIATTDIIEDLLILDQLIVDAGEESFLDDTLLIASVNRGGLAGAAWELNDRATSFSMDSINRLRLDGIKLLWRLDLQNEASGEMLDDCGRVMEEADRAQLPVFFEALPVSKGAQGYQTILSVDEWVKTLGVAAAIGSSSMGLWLQAPPIEGFERVARATTLPILMLDDVAPDSARGLLEQIERGLKAGANVRGVMAGRSVLFPAKKDDPSAIAHGIEAIIHDGTDVPTALARVDEARGATIDWLAKLFH